MDLILFKQWSDVKDIEIQISTNYDNNETQEKQVHLMV